MTPPTPRYKDSFKCSFYDSIARKCVCEAAPVVLVEPFLRFYADTDQTSIVEESIEEWNTRDIKPGAIIIYNCDRDGATKPSLDFEDDRIANNNELQDFAKLVIKQNADLPADCQAFVVLSSTDASKVRGFRNFAAGASPVIGSLSSA